MSNIHSRKELVDLLGTIENDLESQIDYRIPEIARLWREAKKLGYPAQLPEALIQCSSFRMLGMTIADREFLRAIALETARGLLCWLVDDPQPTPKDGKRPKRPKCNDMMLGILQKNGEARGWQLPDWEKATGFAKSTISETKTWKTLHNARESVKAERALGADRHRRTKPVNDPDE